MALDDLKLNSMYRSLRNDIIKDFYMPVLENASSYKRATGFFSSSLLVEISKGICSIAKKGGKIKIITSPRLSKDDLEAMKEGYRKRNDILEESLIRDLLDHEDPGEQDRLNLLAHLIASGTLDIKIALLESNNQIGMFHEKYGIISDDHGNKLVFTGSMNESLTGMTINYESIDVFCSWKGDQERIINREEGFDSVWKNREKHIKTIEVPRLKKAFVEKYRADYCDYDLDINEFVIEENEEDYLDTWIKKPDYLDGLYDYQLEAIDSWEDKNFRGIFDMATGTGKTLTALGGLSRLAKSLDNRLGIIVICPYQHLVEQWVEDIRACGVEPLISYSKYNWKKDFERILRDFRLGIEKNFFIVTTNMTFVTDFFQKQIDRLPKDGPICLVVDEAHNFGTIRQRSCMKDVYKYRLALSATLDRHNDDEGTESLYKFFGDKCIEYGLERAIDEDKLTPYRYYPIAVSLSDQEHEEYEILTKQIARALMGKKKEEDLSDSVKMLLIKRSRIVAGAVEKIDALVENVEKKYLDQAHILVYCGATTIDSYSYSEGKADLEEKRQIEIVMDQLGNRLGMRIAKFTSEENIEEREQIKRDFSDGDMLQALVAIRCLDEGVNIPSIKTAFILASSTNPKEYIQRRGRVLRKYEGKDYAEIYDFITLPRPIDETINKYSIEDWEKKLVEKEFRRLDEFARLAENKIDSDRLKIMIKEKYNLYSIGDDLDEF